jgi:hypothetical protein
VEEKKTKLNIRNEYLGDNTSYYDIPNFEKFTRKIIEEHKSVLNKTEYYDSNEEEDSNIEKIVVEEFETSVKDKISAEHIIKIVEFVPGNTLSKVLEKFEDVDEYEAKVTFEMKESKRHKTADSLIKFVGLDGEFKMNLKVGMDNDDHSGKEKDANENVVKPQSTDKKETNRHEPAGRLKNIVGVQGDLEQNLIQMTMITAMISVTKKYKIIAIQPWKYILRHKVWMQIR